jgi:DNA-binding NtrC family response regulator
MKFGIPNTLDIGQRGQTTLIRAREALEKHEPDRAARLLQRAKITSSEAQMAHDVMLAATLAHCNFPRRALQTVMNSLEQYRDMTGEQRLFHLIVQGDLLGTLGQMKLAVKVLRPCPQKAAALGRKDLAIEALVQEGVAHSALGDQKTGLERIEQALSLGRGSPEAGLVTRALAEKSACLYRCGDFGASLEAARAAVETSRGGDSLARALGYRRIGIVHGALFRFFESLEAHQNALRVFNALAHVPGQLREYLSLADTYINMGDIGLAAHFTQRAQVLAEDGDNPVLSGLVQDRLGRLCLVSGAVSEAVDHYEKQLAIARRGEGCILSARAERHLGIAEIFAGNLDVAFNYLLNAANGFSTSGDVVDTVQTLMELSQIEPLLDAEKRHEVSRLRASLNPIDEDASKTPKQPGTLAETHFIAAYSSLAESRWKEAVTRHGEGVEVLLHHGCYLDAALALYRFGKLALSRNIEASCEILERALKLSDTYGFHDLTKRVLDTIGSIEGRGEEIVVEHSLDKAAVKQLGGDPNLQDDDTRARATSIIGGSPEIEEIIKEIEEFAPTDLPILVLGQSGTGKELVARRAHELSRRATGPFVAVNCATLPSGLIDVELFGGKKGAYTGLPSDRKGLVMEANRGTLFLDEIGDFPIDLQPKLLRFLQEGEVRPLGSDKTDAVDVRIITATNKDLERAVKNGTFREDLYYRLNVVSLELPPLSERGRDILAIAQFFIEQSTLAARKGITGISRAAASLLLSHPWPGNIRELQNVVQVALVRCRATKITTEDLKLKPGPREDVLPPSAEPSASSTDGKLDIKSRDELMYDNIRRTLKATDGNQSEAAKRLGIHRNTLRNWIKRMRKDGRLADDDESRKQS